MDSKMHLSMIMKMEAAQECECMLGCYAVEFM